MSTQDHFPENEPSQPDMPPSKQLVGRTRRRSLLHHIGRRSFLKNVSLFTTTSLTTGAIGLTHSAQTHGNAAYAQATPSNSHEQFRQKAYQVRVDSAEANRSIAIPPHPANGDEERYDNKIGNDSRALPHNERGEVDLDAYNSAIRAYTSGDPADFERIIIGGTRKQLNPIGSLAVSLTGYNTTQLAIPPAPALASAEKAAEAVELYWAALLRDVPFSEYQNNTSNPLVLAAVEEINKLSGFRGPKQNGRVTPQTLFRGTAVYVDQSDSTGRRARYATPPGVLDGPYVSQFVLRQIPFGPQSISPLIRTVLAGNDFLTNYDEWLTVQNGNDSGKTVPFDPVLRYIATGRDLAEFVHNPGALFWGAALLLGTRASSNNLVFSGIGAPLNPSNPYVSSKTQAGGASTFGLPYIQGLLPLATSRAIRVAYWQKFWVHRHLRPEAYGGLVHNKIVNRADYPIHQDILNSQALARSFSKFGTYLLSHVFPEGAPIHSSYPGGASIIAAIHATLLKAFYDENFVIPNPVTVDPSDPTKVIPYTGTPLTVGGELNKLAVNYGGGRNLAGIHTRSDAAASLALGEELGISLLKDEKATFREAFSGFSFTRFDGTKVTI